MYTSSDSGRTMEDTSDEDVEVVRQLITPPPPNTKVSTPTLLKGGCFGSWHLAIAVFGGGGVGYQVSKKAPSQKHLWPGFSFLLFSFVSMIKVLTKSQNSILPLRFVTPSLHTRMPPGSRNG